jgi:heme exporter protein CcmD
MGYCFIGVEIMEALDFGKYNLYIWASYGLTFVVLIWNVVIPLLAKKKLIKDIKRRNYLNNDV